MQFFSDLFDIHNWSRDGIIAVATAVVSIVVVLVLVKRIKAIRERVRITDILIAISTIVIAAAAVVNVHVVKGQLDSMNDSGIDTRNLAEAAKHQLHVMQDQLTEMQSEQRPWIYADIGPGGKIFRDQSGGLTFQIAFRFHNTGRLPAMYVSPDIEGYLSGEGGVIGSRIIRERQQKRCGPPLQQPDTTDQIGVTIFPGQSVLLGSAIGITRDEIDEIVKLEQDKIDKVIFPWGTGCIRYRSPDGAFHQTGVAFTINMLKPGNESARALPIDPTSIDPKSLVIEPWIEGGTAYAN